MAIQWSSWTSLGKPPETELGRPFAQRNQDGRLEVFAPGRVAYSISRNSLRTARGEISGATSRT